MFRPGQLEIFARCSSNHGGASVRPTYLSLNGGIVSLSTMHAECLSRQHIHRDLSSNGTFHGNPLSLAETAVCRGNGEVVLPMYVDLDIKGAPRATADLIGFARDVVVPAFFEHYPSATAAVRSRFRLLICAPDSPTDLRLWGCPVCDDVHLRPFVDNLDIALQCPECNAVFDAEGNSESGLTACQLGIFKSSCHFRTFNGEAVAAAQHYKMLEREGRACGAQNMRGHMQQRLPSCTCADPPPGEDTWPAVTPEQGIGILSNIRYEAMRHPTYREWGTPEQWSDFVDAAPLRNGGASVPTLRVLGTTKAVGCHHCLRNPELMPYCLTCNGTGKYVDFNKQYGVVGVLDADGNMVHDVPISGVDALHACSIRLHHQAASPGFVDFDGIPRVFADKVDAKLYESVISSQPVPKASKAVRGKMTAGRRAAGALPQDTVVLAGTEVQTVTNIVQNAFPNRVYEDVLVTRVTRVGHGSKAHIRVNVDGYNSTFCLHHYCGRPASHAHSLVWFHIRPPKQHGQPGTIVQRCFCTKKKGGSGPCSRVTTVTAHVSNATCRALFPYLRRAELPQAHRSVGGGLGSRRAWRALGVAVGQHAAVHGQHDGSHRTPAVACFGVSGTCGCRVEPRLAHSKNALRHLGDARHRDGRPAAQPRRP